jgi:hypothetical protein
VAVKDLMVRDRKVEVGHIEVTGWN